MIENRNMGMEFNEPPEHDKEKDGLTQEQRELAEFYLSQYPEKDIPKEERKDCEQAIAEFQSMLVEFEAEHPLAELYAITDLTVEDAPSHPIREPARIALIPIVAKLNYLREETNITAERYAELDSQYKYLSKAVGIINGNKVRHS